MLYDVLYDSHVPPTLVVFQKLTDMGEGKWPVYYYENIEGGHGGAADAKQSAFMTALAYDFMFDVLSKNAAAMKE